MDDHPFGTKPYSPWLHRLAVCSGLFLLGFLPTCFPGCVSRSVEGNESVYRSAPWSLPLTLFLGIVIAGLVIWLLLEWAVFAGDRLEKAASDFVGSLTALLSLAALGIAWLAAAGILVMGVGLLTSIFLELFMSKKPEIRVNANRMVDREGGFGPVKEYAIRFEDLAEIRAGNEWQRVDWLPFRDTFVEIAFKNGTKKSLRINDLLKEALPEILERAKAKGVRVTEED